MEARISDLVIALGGHLPRLSLGYHVLAPIVAAEGAQLAVTAGSVQTEPAALTLAVFAALTADSRDAVSRTLSIAGTRVASLRCTDARCAEAALTAIQIGVAGEAAEARALRRSTCRNW